MEEDPPSGQGLDALSLALGYHPDPMGTPLFEPGDQTVVYLVDLSSYILRAYHAVAPLSAPSGEPTHAVHGTVTMLERLYRERQPHLLAIAMDAGRKTFRREIYPDYKANRPPAPDDLRVQIERAEQIVRASGLAVFKQEGAEADDLIATAVTRLRRQGRSIVIVGADKDLMQLVSDDVLLWDTLRNKVFGPKEVQERFGVEPHKLGDLLALMGDSSDNIPGVPSIGPKTAATLIADYEDLDGIFSHVGEIKRKKLRETLQTHEEDARLSKRLVTLKTDCDIDISDENLTFANPSRRNEPALLELFETLGFTRQLAQLRSGTTEIQKASEQQRSSLAHSSPAPNSKKTEAPRQSTPPTVITDETELEKLLLALEEGDWALEICSTHPSSHSGPLVALCVTSPTHSYYIPFAHRYVGAPRQLEGLLTTSRIFQALAGENARLATHHLKRAIVTCARAGVSSELPRCHDTLLASYLLDPEQGHQLETLGTRFGVEVPEFDTIAREGRKKRPLDELSVESAADFYQKRTTAILRAATEQRELLADTRLGSLLEDVEAPLSRILAEMEVGGVLIDTAVLEKIGHECEVRLRQLELEAHQVAGKEFNLNSPRQLETILFDEVGLKPLRRTKTSRSTDAQTLEALAAEHPLPDLILRHRQVAKLKGTYIDSLPDLMNPNTGRVHTSWEQAVAATGRLSSTDPNLQNIPIRSELGQAIREAFVAPPGHLLLSADYSQIELRVLAHLSQDARLVEAFKTGQDVHTRTAMEIFEVEESEITREMRARAKAVNFGVIYGQGESGLAKALKIERKVAASFIAAYFRRYEGVRRFLDETLERARQGEAVQSLLGRRRIVSDIKSGNRARRLAAERIAMNMPIQGSAADILKLAMLRFQTPPTPGCKMVLTVHDELVFEVVEAELEQAKIRVKEAMENAYQLSVPLTVTVGAASNWRQAH